MFTLQSIQTPAVMAIINLTPDSFYAESRCIDEYSIVQRAEQALQEGATVLDIGGCSTRPAVQAGKQVLATAEEEWQRLSQGLQWIRQAFPNAILSVDTFRSEIAERAVQDYGVQIINDVTGGEGDEQMFATVANLGVPYVLTSQENTLVSVVNDLQQKTNILHQMGVKEVLIDPGFGFGKTQTEDLMILRELSQLKTMLGLPILVGLSRKRMVYNSLNISPENALNGTTALHMLALMNGASILRVHDVKEAVETVKLWKKMAEL